MKVILLGATGMVGQGALRECLRDERVSDVLVIGRTELGVEHAKLRQIVAPDLAELMTRTDVVNELSGYDACFFCLGVSSAGMTEEAYRRITYDLTLTVARALSGRNPGLRFVYVSGQGTDSTEQGRSMWARVKGRTENRLLELPMDTYLFRPGTSSRCTASGRGPVCTAPSTRWPHRCTRFSGGSRRTRSRPPRPWDAR
ncbi:NAD-dependent epimerase/dehydratase family protein [Streptomyces sp. NPDC055709]